MLPFKKASLKSSRPSPVCLLSRECIASCVVEGMQGGTDILRHSSQTLNGRFVPRRWVTLYLASPACPLPQLRHSRKRTTDGRIDGRTVSGTVKRRALSIVPLSSKGEDSCYRMTDSLAMLQGASIYVSPLNFALSLLLVEVK